MTRRDKSFIPNAGLEHAIDLLRHPPSKQDELPDSFADHGSGELATLNLLAPQVPGSATSLDSPHELAHMGCPYALDHMGNNMNLYLKGCARLARLMARYGFDQWQHSLYSLY